MNRTIYLFLSCTYHMTWLNKTHQNIYIKKSSAADRYLDKIKHCNSSKLWRSFWRQKKNERDAKNERDEKALMLPSLPYKTAHAWRRNKWTSVSCLIKTDSRKIQCADESSALAMGSKIFVCFHAPLTLIDTLKLVPRIKPNIIGCISKMYSAKFNFYPVAGCFSA